MKGFIRRAPLFFAVLTACAGGLISAAPTHADQQGVNKCGKEIAKSSGKILKLLNDKFLKCYTKRHACAPLAEPSKTACLDATLATHCSCEALDIRHTLNCRDVGVPHACCTGVGTGCECVGVEDPLACCMGLGEGCKTGEKLAILEAKIASKCNYNINTDITMDELLYNHADNDLCVGVDDPEDCCTGVDAGTCDDKRSHIAFAPKRNCKCGLEVGDMDGEVEDYEEVQECMRFLLVMQAVNQVGWDTDPRAQDEIFDILVDCGITLADQCP